MSAVPRKEVTTREVTSIRFGMYTDEEVSVRVGRERGRTPRAGRRSPLTARHHRAAFSPCAQRH